MFPIQIEPADALKELVDFNQKLLKGIDSIADVREIDVAPTPREVVYQEDKVTLYHYAPDGERSASDPGD